MNNNFDQDNVFDEQQSAFDGPADATPMASKVVKKEGGSIPVWLWALIAVMVLLVTFVIVKIISGRREANAPTAIAPIVQTAQSPAASAPAPAPVSIQPMVQEPAQPPSATPVADALPIPGEEPAAPQAAAAPTVQPEPAATAPVPAPAPVSASPTPAAPAPAAQKAATPMAGDERKQLTDRIEALSSDVESLRRQLLEQQERNKTKPHSPRRQPVAVAPARKPAGAAQPEQVPPAPIEGLTLKAVVENSAWLQTQSGETVMVQPGDVIHGVGTVKSIDPDAGAVRLSDGRVLR
jgi:hypothetical protein